jgi:signal transduction histidine kinase
MSFQITARTILHLGAELISSDAVALYELIKNTIDANSPKGVDVQVLIVIRESDFASVLAAAEAEDSELTLEDVKNELLGHVLPNAPELLREKFEAAVSEARSLETLIRRAKDAYRVCNQIIVADEGHGMSAKDLKEVYLTIGTTNRTNAVRQSVKDGDSKPPYLGEKGVGRLSVMRLGRMVRIETATKEDVKVNILEIDWNWFEEAYDKPADSVKLTPILGAAKVKGISFTRIVISDLRASWSRARLAEVARDQIARMMDPFSWDERRRFPIKLSFNGEPIEQARTVAVDLLKNSHAKCDGEFSIVDGRASLKVTFQSDLYNGAPKTQEFDLIDLLSMSGLKQSGQPPSTLRSLGAFRFEFYWFNRQRLRALEGVGDRETVRGLIKAWSGVSLFRDGYRVLPYGDEGDDWLGLDREALAAGGYKLNTKQIIGRVRIGRVTNPRLLDQTNRQGLTDCPEKAVLIQLLKDVISHWWHDYLDEVGRSLKAEKALAFDTVKETGTVDDLERRTKESLRSIRKHYSGDVQTIQDVKDAFVEIKDAHTRAVERIGAIEEEKERLTQLAGIGLLIEVIAHELTRATEATQDTLKTISRKNIDSGTAAAFRVLGQQIKVIQKRLQTLEPLSVPARQRRSVQNVGQIASYVLEAHKDQFVRHKISASISRRSERATNAFIIEGHLVQILENLINNSVYWLDIERSDHASFEPSIEITILSDPPRIHYKDNGPGVPANRAESVFEPFFSTKVATAARRRGLGLYIARQNAEMLGGTLALTDEGSERAGRFNTFELELKESAE